PQASVPPQPSSLVPQFLPTEAHVFAMQPHTFGVPPPPHVWGNVHAPQLMLLPQPVSTLVSHLPPQVFCTQLLPPQTLARPAMLPVPTPHSHGLKQRPQLMRRPHPSEAR